MTKEIQGTLVIATSPSGLVHSETDFAQSKPASLDLATTQEIRARERLYSRIIHECCNGDFAKAITSSSYLTQAVIESVRENGWRFDARTIMATIPEEDQCG